MSLESMSFILGGLLVSVGLVGGGIEVRDLKVPSVGRASRLFSFFGGIVFIGLAVFLGARGIEGPFAGMRAADADLEIASAGNERQPEEHPSEAPNEWMTPYQYQMAFESKGREGFYPFKIEGRCRDDSVELRSQWKKLPFGTGFYSYNAMTKDVYEKENREQTAKGYSLETLNRFRDCAGIERYQATWLKK